MEAAACVQPGGSCTRVEDCCSDGATLGVKGYTKIIVTCDREHPSDVGPTCGVGMI